VKWHITPVYLETIPFESLRDFTVQSVEANLQKSSWQFCNFCLSHFESLVLYFGKTPSDDLHSFKQLLFCECESAVS